MRLESSRVQNGGIRQSDHGDKKKKNELGSTK